MKTACVVCDGLGCEHCPAVGVLGAVLTEHGQVLLAGPTDGYYRGLIPPYDVEPDDEPGEERDEWEEAQLAISSLRGSVAAMLDARISARVIRYHVERAMSDWCDEQGEPRL